MWRALKPQGVVTPCGCETDDDSLSDEHVDESRDQSRADFQRQHHYPKEHTPKTWCVTHKSERPCECDAPKKSIKQPEPPPKTKKTKR